MKNILLKVTYDGTHFFGWQKTGGKPTIEGELEGCLRQVLQEPVVLQAASRTDRGVHAEEQYVNFFTNKGKSLAELHKSLNSLLPPAIRILTVQEVPADFHPTLNALKKEYHYQISTALHQPPKERFFSWHVPYPLDLKKMETALPYFVGERDYSSFCNVRKNLNYKDKKRSIESLQMHQPQGDILLISIVGERFLYKMVRNIVGTLIYIGRDLIPLEELPQIFAAQSRPLAGITAPAHGLTLKKIYYSQLGYVP